MQKTQIKLAFTTCDIVEKTSKKHEFCVIDQTVVDRLEIFVEVTHPRPKQQQDSKQQTCIEPLYGISKGELRSSPKTN